MATMTMTEPVICELASPERQENVRGSENMRGGRGGHHKHRGARRVGNGSPFGGTAGDGGGGGIPTEPWRQAHPQQWGEPESFQPDGQAGGLQSPGVDPRALSDATPSRRKYHFSKTSRYQWG